MSSVPAGQIAQRSSSQKERHEKWAPTGSNEGNRTKCVSLCAHGFVCVCVCVFGCECFPLSKMYGCPATFTAVIDCWSPSVNTKKLHNHATRGPQPRWDQTLPSSFVNLCSQTSPMFSYCCLLTVEVWGWNFPASAASRCTTPNVQTKSMADRDKLMFLWQVYTQLKPQQCSLKTTVKKTTHKVTDILYTLKHNSCLQIHYTSFPRGLPLSCIFKRIYPDFFMNSVDRRRQSKSQGLYLKRLEAGIQIK